ncbi:MULTISPECIES: MerR [unclassified Saccharopolyspora]|uniref:MerR n=1 Tax=unclassified Saccharopolyspora TaxID=2646250 RepID=UPI001CD577B1|nr:MULTISPECIES: MerR [unclassified Saccharopolyspora]MCA1188736.1 MerR [Saccharopolyspora sp. 6T]MCA1192099.1 MerR [Saccharopolyspora sp. 6V]MCA1226127.1 MerR [Saccharopolyspora sp. 6M]MCA1280260.1 MerR [Saccharopolyspora sp. 7B]
MSGVQRNHYTVDVAREDDLWVAAVRELDGGVTDVERFDDLDVEVRDMVRLLVDVPEDSFDLSWHYRQGDVEYTRPVEELVHWREQSRRAAENAERARLEIITTLRAAGLSQRVIAEVIGTSHQRVAQLLAEAS